MLGAGQSVDAAFFSLNRRLYYWEHNAGLIGILRCTSPRQRADESVGGRASLHSFSLCDISSGTCFELCVCRFGRGAWGSDAHPRFRTSLSGPNRPGISLSLHSAWAQLGSSQLPMDRWLTFLASVATRLRHPEEITIMCHYLTTLHFEMGSRSTAHTVFVCLSSRSRKQMQSDLSRPGAT